MNETPWWARCYLKKHYDRLWAEVVQNDPDYVRRMSRGVSGAHLPPRVIQHLQELLEVAHG